MLKDDEEYKNLTEITIAPPEFDRLYEEKRGVEYKTFKGIMAAIRPQLDIIARDKADDRGSPERQSYSMHFMQRKSSRNGSVNFEKIIQN